MSSILEDLFLWPSVFSDLDLSCIFIRRRFRITAAWERMGNPWNNSTRFLLMLVWEGHLDWAHHTDFMGTRRERAVTTRGWRGLFVHVYCFLVLQY